jgi:hypothetical protein
MSEDSNTGADGTPQAPVASGGDVPIPGEGSTSPTMSAGNQPIAGEGTSVAQRAGGIAGENTQAIVAGGGLPGEGTQLLHEAGVPAESTGPVAKDAGDS